MPDFNYAADNVIEEEINFDTLVSQFENGFEQRRSRRASPLRKFKLTFKTRTKNEMIGVKDFFTAKKGGYQSFTWLNPNDNEEYQVRFEKDSFNFKRIAFNIFDFEAEFIEVRA
jgi:phage-related protein